MAYEIDLLRDELFDELGKTRLKESYMKEDEESPQERFKFVCDFFALCRFGFFYHRLFNNDKICLNTSIASHSSCFCRITRRITVHIFC